MYFTEKEIKNNKISELSCINWYEKGLELYKKSDYKEAIECFEMALTANTDNLNALSKKASSLYHLGKFKKAVKCYNKIIEMYPHTPDSIKAWRNKGYILFLQGKFKETIECYDKVLNFFPGDMDTRLKRDEIRKLLKQNLKLLKRNNSGTVR